MAGPDPARPRVRAPPGPPHGAPRATARGLEGSTAAESARETPRPKVPTVSAARRILAGTAYRAVAEVLGKLASIVLYVVMARKLGEADFGVFTFAFALVTLATTVANIGQDTIMTREVARDRGRLRGYFGDAVTTKLAIAVPALGVAVGIVALFGDDAETTAVTGVLAFGVLLDLATSSCFAVFQALERFAAVAAALVTQRILTAVLGVAALAAGASVSAVAVMFVVGSVAALAVAATLLRRYVGRGDLDVAPS